MGMKGIHRQHAGQALVEFAMVVGLLLYIIFAGFAYYQIIWSAQTVMDAANTAAHYAALIGGDDGEVAQEARDVLEEGLSTSATYATVTVTCARPCQRYAEIAVTVIYDAPIWVWIPGVPQRVQATFTATRLSEKDQEAVW
jgi:Flp pilus assembly protein TadG